MRKIAGLVLGLWALLGVSAAAASEHVYPLQNHTGLVLPVPGDWKEEIRRAPGDGPQSLFFTPQEGTAFAVAVTPIVAMRDGSSLPDTKAIHGLVLASSRQVAPRAVERQIALKPLIGPTCKGYYFFVTDRAPPPGDWKYLTEGIVRVGGIDVAFEVLTNDGQEAVAKAALDMIRHARTVSPGDVGAPPVAQTAR